MKIQKRDGRLVEFNRQKIINAVLSAFREVDGNITEYATLKATNIAAHVESYYTNHIDEIPTVESIQDMVERGLQSTKRKDVAKAYILYRQARTNARGNSTDDTIIGIIDGTDEYWMNENSNKNADIISTQRDYLAGTVCTDMARRKFFPKELIEAHDIGAIHMHDADYSPIQRMNNCMLINLEDILQNGTVINGVMVDKPHTFSTACNIACQVAACVGSEQYGGQTWSIAHLAPFVNLTREKIRQEVEQDLVENNINLAEDNIRVIVERKVKKEIEKGVQTMQYQINTMSTTNGQAPFVSQVLDIEEVPEGTVREDLVLIIEEILKQRILGVKNKKGVYIAPTFPKLLYILSESNCTEQSPYWWLTKLAAECTAKRMVPDYISKKIMLRDKGDVYGCMGCRSFLTPDISNDGFKNVSKSLNYDYAHPKHQYYGRLTY